MNTTLKKQINRTLALAILNLRDEEEILQFLKEFLTQEEFDILTKRLSVAYYLSKNRNSANIKKNLSVSNLVISQTKEIVDKETIKKVLREIDADEWAEKWSHKVKNLYAKLF